MLLSSTPYAELARASPYFDEVWVDSRPPLWDAPGWLRLRRKLRGGRFARVYDLQTSDRSRAYFHLLGRPRPEWSGIARGCSHPHDNPARDSLHTIERQREQLAGAGILDVPAPDLGWLDGPLALFDLPPIFALLVPGGAPCRPAKRWPAEQYASLANALFARGVTPVLIGTVAEQKAIQAILAACPAARDLSARTSFGQLAALARQARFAIGNDTGPMHLIACAGCPTLVLFSGESDPTLCAPRGRAVRILREPALHTLDGERVLTALEELAAQGQTDG